MKLISVFVFAIQIVQSLYFLNPKFQASIHLLWLYSLVCVGPGQANQRQVFSRCGSYPKMCHDEVEVYHKVMINLNLSYWISQNIVTDLKRSKEKYCPVDDVQGDFLRQPHGTTPGAITVREANYYFCPYRFTSVIRTGLEFAGTEKITVGGGEAVWLYINKVLVVEFISNGTGTDNCYKIDLSPAASAGKF